MSKIVIKPYDVISKTGLPELTVDLVPTDGDPLEIGGELFFVCTRNTELQSEHPVVGVIPLIVRNPGQIRNIEDYIQCLSLAHRKVLFKNKKGECDLASCETMIIS